MTILNETLNPISAAERVKINQNWKMISARFSNLQGQIQLVSGGEDVEAIITRIETTISNAENATNNTVLALQEVSVALSDLQTIMDNANTLNDNVQAAINSLNSSLNAMVYTGPYDNATTYEKGNYTRLQKDSYVALKQNLGIAPSDDGVNWRLVAVGGTDGMGSVSSINNVSPNPDGNVELDLVPIQDFENLRQSYLNNSNDFINVKNNGAVGDGITDDTAAIQRAINIADTNKAYVVFPNSNYVITSNLNIPSGVKGIMGFGKAQIIQNGIDYVGISINDTNDFVIENLSFTGDVTNKTTLMFFQRNRNLTIRDCSFVNTGASCISLANTTNANIHNCYFNNTGVVSSTDPTHPSNPSIWVGQAPDFTNTNIDIYKCRFNETVWSGIYFFPKGGTIRECTFLNCGESSIFVDYEASDIVISGNKIDGARAVNIAAFGIELGGVRSCEITNNYITNCDEAGIAAGGVYDYNISNNRCINNGKGAGSNEQKAGILFRLIGRENLRGVVSNNILTDNRDTGKTQLYGISTQRYDATTFYIAGTIFANNYLKGNQISPIRFVDEGVIVGDDVVFKGNIGYGENPTTIIRTMPAQTGLMNIQGIGFRPRFIHIEAFANNINAKSLTDITAVGNGLVKNILFYENKLEENTTAWAIKDGTGRTLNYAEIAGFTNDGFNVNVGFAEIPVTLIITAYT